MSKRTTTVVSFEVRMVVPEGKNLAELSQLIRNAMSNHFPNAAKDADHPVVVKLKEKRTFYA